MSSSTNNRHLAYLVGMTLFSSKESGIIAQLPVGTVVKMDFEPEKGAFNDEVDESNTYRVSEQRGGSCGTCVGYVGTGRSIFAVIPGTRLQVLAIPGVELTAQQIRRLPRQMNLVYRTNNSFSNPFNPNDPSTFSGVRDHVYSACDMTSIGCGVGYLAGTEPPIPTIKPAPVQQKQFKVGDVIRGRYAHDELPDGTVVRWRGQDLIVTTYRNTENDFKKFLARKVGDTEGSLMYVGDTAEIVALPGPTYDYLVGCSGRLYRRSKAGGEYELFDRYPSNTWKQWGVFSPSVRRNNGHLTEAQAKLEFPEAFNITPTITATVKPNPTAAELPAGTVFRQGGGVYLRISNGICKVISTSKGTTLAWVSKDTAEEKLAKPFDSTAGNLDLSAIPV